MGVGDGVLVGAVSVRVALGAMVGVGGGVPVVSLDGIVGLGGILGVGATGVVTVAGDSSVCSDVGSDEELQAASASSINIARVVADMRRK